MSYRIKVLRDAEIKLPDRCCGCGAASSNQLIKFAAKPMKDGFGESFGAPQLTVPMCAFCNLKRRVTFWLMALLAIALLIVSLLILPVLSHHFGRETSSWMVVAFVGCSLLVALIARQIYMPISAQASFDEHWIVCQFHSKSFWEEFYELNRASARVTEDA